MINIKEILQHKLLIEELQKQKEVKKERIKIYKEQLKKYPIFYSYIISFETAFVLAFFQSDKLLNITYKFSTDFNATILIISLLSIVSGIVTHKITKYHFKWKLKAEECLYESVCYNLTNKKRELAKKEIKEIILNINEELKDEDYIEKIKKTTRELIIFQDYLMNYKDFCKWQKTDSLYRKLDNGYYDEECIKYIENIMVNSKVRQRKSKE